MAKFIIETKGNQVTRNNLLVALVYDFGLDVIVSVENLSNSDDASTPAQARITKAMKYAVELERCKMKHKDSGDRCSVFHSHSEGRRLPACIKCSECGEWLRPEAFASGVCHAPDVVDSAASV